MRKCCSQNRCGRLDCGNCSWRAAGHVARRIMANDPRHLHAVSIEVPISSLADFWLWRVQARNVVDYRRASRWWSELTLCVWLRHDNRLCGILSLGAVTPDEFLAAVRRRWPITLQTIDPEKVREEVYAVIRPGQIADFGSKQGRYYYCVISWRGMGGDPGACGGRDGSPVARWRKRVTLRRLPRAADPSFGACGPGRPVPGVLCWADAARPAQER
jgi:hypothetical protein